MRIVVLLLAACASEPAGHVERCTLDIQQGSLGTADVDEPCLVDSQDRDAFTTQWIADACPGGARCSARCEATAQTCSP